MIIEGYSQMTRWQQIVAWNKGRSLFRIIVGVTFHILLSPIRLISSVFDCVGNFFLNCHDFLTGKVRRWMNERVNLPPEIEPVDLPPKD